MDTDNDIAKTKNGDLDFNVSDFMDIEIEKNDRFACFNRLAQIRNIIKKPICSESSQKMFDNKITSNKKSLSFTFEKLQNSNIATEPEIISISSESSSVINSNESKSFTPRKPIVGKNRPKCRKSLFRAIINQDLKKRQGSSEKTLTETNFSPQTYSTPLSKKQIERNAEETLHINQNVDENNMQKEDLKNNLENDDDNMDNNQQNKEDDEEDDLNMEACKMNSYTLKAKHIDNKCDETLNSNINNTIEKNNQGVTCKTTNNSVDMELTNVQEDLLYNVPKPNRSLTLNCKPSKIPQSKTSLRKNVKVGLSQNRIASSVGQLTDNSYEKDQIEKKKQKPPISISPPIPIVTSPTIVINQVFNNGAPTNNHSLPNILSNDSKTKIITVEIIPPPVENNLNTKTISVGLETIPPPAGFHSSLQSEKDNNMEEDFGDITSDDDPVKEKNHKTLHFEHIKRNENETELVKDLVSNKDFKSITSKFNKSNAIITDNKTLDKKISKNKTSMNTTFDYSLITEEEDTSATQEDPNTLCKGETISNMLDETEAINEINIQNCSKKRKKLSNSVISQKKSVPLDLRKKKRVSKKNSLRSSLSKKKPKKVDAPPSLQDYFSNTKNNNTFDKLLNSQDSAPPKKNDGNTKSSKINNQNIPKPRNNLNNLGAKPFNFREINELELAAKKRKRYSNQNLVYNPIRTRSQSKTTIVNSSQINEIVNLNSENNLNDAELKILKQRECTNNSERMSSNESNFCWPSPPSEALINNLDSEIVKTNSRNQTSFRSPFFPENLMENKENSALLIIKSTRDLHKRKLSLDRSTLNNINTQPNLIKKQKIIGSINVNNNTTSLVLEENDDLVNDDPAAANKIWLDAANTINSVNSRNSSTLRKSRESKKQYIEEYLQLSNNIQHKSKKEKRKLYEKDPSSSEFNTEKQSEASTSKENEPTEFNCDALVVSKPLYQADHIISDDLLFKKPLKPVSRKVKNKTEVQGLLRIHPMYKLSEDQISIQNIVDDNGNEIRRSSRKKASNPLYDVKKYFKLYIQERKRMHEKASKMNFKASNKLRKIKENNHKIALSNINEIETSNDIDINLPSQNNNVVKITEEKDNGKKQAKNKNINNLYKNNNENQEFVSATEAFQDNTNLISKRSHKSKKPAVISNLNKNHLKRNYIENTIETEEVESHERSNEYNSSRKQNSTTKSWDKVYVKLKREKINQNGQNELGGEKDQPIVNRRPTKSKVLESKKRKPVLSDIELNGHEPSVPLQTAKPHRSEIISDIESNSNTGSKSSERLNFFNWIMNFNCNLNKSTEHNPDYSYATEEGYRLGSLANMIFEKRHGIYYALYRTAVTSGYMKLLPGTRKPKAKSGRYSLKFLVLAGCVNASINNNKIIFNPGDHIEVEKSQMYSIQNQTNEVCCLYFTRIE